VTVVAHDGRRYHYCIELDNATQSIRSETNLDALEWKIRRYEAWQYAAAERGENFRVLFATTGSRAHAKNIVAAAADVLLEPRRELVLSCRLEDYLAAPNPFTQPVPSDRICDVVSFDVADRRHPLGFNILDCSDPDRFALVADGVVSAFKKVFGLSEAETPRLISILRNSLLTLVEMPGTTLHDIGRLLTEEPYRALAIRRVSNPVVKAYWVHRFGKWTRSERTKAVEAVLNKVDSFATTPLLQRIVGQPRNGLNLRRAMDEGRIVLVNLSKGSVGEDAANMLGSLLVTQLQLDAMSRADLPPHDRRPFFVYIDEFQNFATESFPAILSEARKFGLGLIAAHQYLDQVPPETAKALFGNVGTLISFQVGADDAELLARQFSRDKGDIQERDLINLPRYHALVRLLVDGMPTRRFTMQMCEPAERQSPGDCRCDSLPLPGNQRGESGGRRLDVSAA
jgi:hypothetical protein